MSDLEDKMKGEDFSNVRGIGLFNHFREENLSQLLFGVDHEKMFNDLIPVLKMDRLFYWFSLIRCYSDDLKDKIDLEESIQTILNIGKNQSSDWSFNDAKNAFFNAMTYACDEFDDGIKNGKYIGKKFSETCNLSDLVECSGIELNTHHVVKKIGGGASATTYLLKSIDPRLDKMRYVLKIFKPDKVNVKEVERNDKLKNDISGPDALHLCDIIDTLNIRGGGKTIKSRKRYAMLMHYAGEDLALILKKGKIKLGVAHNYFNQMIKGISALYNEKQIHRDIRPANIFVKDNHVTIGDFGITVDSDSFEYKYNKRYRAPITFTGDNPDLFSAGLVYYEMLTGEHLIVPKSEDLDSTEYVKLIMGGMEEFYDENGLIAKKYLKKINKLDWDFKASIIDCLSKDMNFETFIEKKRMREESSGKRGINEKWIEKMEKMQGEGKYWSNGGEGV